jgi:flagellar biosynthesis/type III secretory pathway protein FliH
MTSSSERAWAPPALTREPAIAPPVSGSAAWFLADLGGPPLSAVPVDASYESGYADGLRDGVSQAHAHLEPALRALHGVARALEERRTEIFGDRERDLQALALAVARRLVQREVEADPRLLADWITHAVAMLPNDIQINVRLHPEDLALLGALRDAVVPADAGVTLHWSADAEVGRAGFVVESPQRLVDGRLDMALRRLYERFEKE